MNPIELKAYILNKVKDVKDVDITMNEDDSFYVKVKYDLRSCGALFFTNWIYVSNDWCLIRLFRI